MAWLPLLTVILNAHATCCNVTCCSIMCTLYTYW